MSESDLREYCVIVKDMQFLNELYDDMETPGGNLYIPDRAVECVDRKSISRSTRYMLAEDEAVQLRRDPRIEAVVLNSRDAGLEDGYRGAPRQSRNWNKSPFASATDLNWGLARCTNLKPTLYGNFPYPNYVDYQNVANASTAPTATGAPDSGVPDDSDPALQGYFVLNLANLRLWDWRTKTQPIPFTWGYSATNKPWGWWTDLFSPDFLDPVPATSMYENVLATGKNVDVVIIDGGIVDPNHPEFAKNPNGSGGTRCVQYNWYQHNQELGFGPNGNYSYALPGKINSHATHVTGTVAGNTQGWAKDANIYNISYTDNLSSRLIDYVRAFHRNKPINPATGRRNPTICNNSWGKIFPSIALNAIHKITYEEPGKPEVILTQRPANGWSVTSQDDTNITWWHVSCQQKSDRTWETQVANGRDLELDADMMDSMLEGIVHVNAAGNSNWPMFNPGDEVWSKHGKKMGEAQYVFMYLTHPTTNTTVKWEYLTGGSPDMSASKSNMQSFNICVGAMDNTPWDMKASFSNYGSAVDFYAPGVAIMSSYLNEPNYTYSYKANSVVEIPAVRDPRNTNYFFQKIQGTSMASPQICGIIACLAETYYHWNARQFKNYLFATAEYFGYQNTENNINPSLSASQKVPNRPTGMVDTSYIPSSIFYSNNGMFRFNDNGTYSGLMDWPNRIVKLKNQRASHDRTEIQSGKISINSVEWPKINYGTRVLIEKLHSKTDSSSDELPYEKYYQMIDGPAPSLYPDIGINWPRRRTRLL